MSRPPISSPLLYMWVSALAEHGMWWNHLVWTERDIDVKCLVEGRDDPGRGVPRGVRAVRPYRAPKYEVYLMYSNIVGFNFGNLQSNLSQNEVQIAPRSHTSYSWLSIVRRPAFRSAAAAVLDSIEGKLDATSSSVAHWHSCLVEAERTRAWRSLSRCWLAVTDRQTWVVRRLRAMPTPRRLWQPRRC